ncbi:YdcF family protein [Staphylococcus pasteuri]|uniref:YdcF family protein n=1 Tax=Staphylococcus pasteuri TaxID=45972 RepID=UPI000D341BB5|nr:YdcF family protein [Staphylococcus pasteuri]PTU83989.1 YdcF family protein [Staphylococcus pasteuri]
MIPLLFTLLILIILFSLFFNQFITLSITGFISTIILGFITLIYHLISYSIPYELIAIIIMIFMYIILKHASIFRNKQGRRFIKQMTLSGVRLILFIIACFYISTCPIPILNGIILWLSFIGLSTLFAFFCYVFWSSAYGSTHFQKPIDLIIILGAGIFTEEVTPMLKERLDRAYDIYRQFHNSPMILVSGGQGPDEPITEALAMQRYLIHRGVPKEHILLEQQSTNTNTNFIYSKEIIRKHFNIKPKILCVTSQFHILRALKLAKNHDIHAYGIGSHTPYHFFHIALIRDFLGVMYQYRLLLTIYFALTFWLSIIILWIK